MKNLYPLLACVIISMNFLTLVPGIVYAQQGEVIVPNVTGIKQELAIQILRTTGLQAQIQNMSHSSDIIVQQSPQPGIYLSMGSVVTLVSTSVFKESSASWSSQQQNQITTYPSPSFQPAQTASVYQLYQVPASQYWVGQTQVKRYPIWYPKQFLPQQIPNSFQDISFPPSTTQRLFVQMTTSSDGVSFIKVIPGNGASKTPLPQDDTQTLSPSFSPYLPKLGYVPVPKLYKLLLKDAIFMLQKAKLTKGIIAPTQFAQDLNRRVISQYPQHGFWVPVGTRIDLYLEN